MWCARIGADGRVWAAAGVGAAGMRMGGEGRTPARCDPSSDALGSIMCWSVASVLAAEVLYDVTRRPTAGPQTVEVGTRSEDGTLPSSGAAAGAPGGGGSVALTATRSEPMAGQTSLERAHEPAISLNAVVTLSAAAIVATCFIVGQQTARASIPVYMSRAQTSRQPARAATSGTVRQRQQKIDARRLAWRSRPGLGLRSVESNESISSNSAQTATQGVQVQRSMSQVRVHITSAATVAERQQAIEARRKAWRSRSGLAARVEQPTLVDSIPPRGRRSRADSARRPNLHRGTGWLQPRALAIPAPQSDYFHYALTNDELSLPTHISELPQLVQNGSLQGNTMVWWEGIDNWVAYADCMGTLGAALIATRPPVRISVSKASQKGDLIAMLKSLPPRGLHSYSYSATKPRSSSRRERANRLPALVQASIEDVQETEGVVRTATAAELHSSEFTGPAPHSVPHWKASESLRVPNSQEAQVEGVLSTLASMTASDVTALLQRARAAESIAELRSIVKENGLPVRNSGESSSALVRVCPNLEQHILLLLS